MATAHMTGDGDGDGDVVVIAVRIFDESIFFTLFVHSHAENNCNFLQRK
jgi:hypothetical protein